MRPLVLSQDKYWEQGESMSAASRGGRWFRSISSLRLASAIWIVLRQPVTRCRGVVGLACWSVGSGCRGGGLSRGKVDVRDRGSVWVGSSSYIIRRLTTYLASWFLCQTTGYNFSVACSWQSTRQDRDSDLFHLNISLEKNSSISKCLS